MSFSYAAEKRGGDVTHVEDPPAGEAYYCADCGEPNEVADEEERREAETHFQSEPY